MRVLMISRDYKIFAENEKVRQRIIAYARQIESLAVIVIGGKNIKKENIGNVVFVGWSWLTCLRYFCLAKKKLIIKPDVITVQEPIFAFALAWKMKKQFAAKIETQLHSDYGGEKWSRGYIRAFLLKIIVSNIKKSDQVRAVSQRIVNWLISIGLPTEKIFLAPVPLSIKIKQTIRQEKNGQINILFAGRLEKEKNLTMLIDAIAKAQKKVREKLILNLVGSGKLFDKLKKYGRKKLQNDFFITPWQTDLSTFFSQANLFVLSSDYEGYCLVVLEASCWGLPIAMTDVGLAGEVLINEQSALISPVGDVNKLADNIIKICHDKEFAAKLVENAQTKIASLIIGDAAINKVVIGWKNMIR
jgi:glycosyltransferase involved in cell wall biosynthesis